MKLQPRYLRGLLCPYPWVAWPAMFLWLLHSKHYTITNLILNTCIHKGLIYNNAYNYTSSVHVTIMSYYFYYQQDRIVVTHRSEEEVDHRKEEESTNFNNCLLLFTYMYYSLYCVQMGGISITALNIVLFIITYIVYFNYMNTIIFKK